MTSTVLNYFYWSFDKVNFKILSTNFKVNCTNMHFGCGNGQRWLFNSYDLSEKENVSKTV